MGLFMELVEKLIVKRKKQRGTEKVDSKKKGKLYRKSAQGKKTARLAKKDKARRPEKNGMTWDKATKKYTKKKKFKTVG